MRQLLVTVLIILTCMMCSCGNEDNIDTDKTLERKLQLYYSEVNYEQENKLAYDEEINNLCQAYIGETVDNNDMVNENIYTYFKKISDSYESSDYYEECETDRKAIENNDAGMNYDVTVNINYTRDCIIAKAYFSSQVRVLKFTTDENGNIDEVMEYR